MPSAVLHRTVHTQREIAMSLVRHDIEVLEDSPIVEVWRMGYGDPSVIGMFAGEPDVPTPDFICEATAQALKDGKKVCTPAGFRNLLMLPLARGCAQATAATRMQCAYADYSNQLFRRRHPPGHRSAWSSNGTGPRATRGWVLHTMGSSSGRRPSRPTRTVRHALAASIH